MIENWPESEISKIVPSFVNLGIGGDKAYSAIWRLTHADWQAYQPKYVVTLLGTNDLNFVDHSCAIVLGLQRVIELIKITWPMAQVEVIDILPRGHDFRNRLQDRKEIGEGLRRYFEKDKAVRFINVDEIITCGGKFPCPNFRPDGHLTAAGYDVLTAALLAAIHPNSTRQK